MVQPAMADWRPIFDDGLPEDPLEDEERRTRKRERKDRKKLIGRRIRFREDPEVTAYWRRENPGTWFPDDGMTGTIVGMPKVGVIGEGPTVEWDCGRRSTLSSLSSYVLV